MIQFDEHIFERGWFNHQLDDELQDLPRIVGIYPPPSKNDK